MSERNILLLSDDPDVLAVLSERLTREGLRVFVATSAESGVAQAAKVGVALAVVDATMNEGLGALQALRASRATRAATLVLAGGPEADVVAAYGAGADDVLVKPVAPRIAVAHVRAILRCVQPAAIREAPPPTRYVLGPVAVDFERHEVRLRGQPLPLTLAEYRLVATLVTRPGCVFTREQLLLGITGGETDVTDRNVDVHVKMIRKKLGDDRDWIQTVRGVGYKCREA